MATFNLGPLILGFSLSAFTQQAIAVNSPAGTPLSNPYRDTIGSYTLTIHDSDQVASLLLSQEEFAKWNNPDSGYRSTNCTQLTKTLYQFFKDDFDFIFIINNNVKIPSAFTYAGSLTRTSSNIRGISADTAPNHDSYYGSQGKLQALMHFPFIGAIQGGPTLHELAHNWANYFRAFELYSNSTKTSTLTMGHWGWTGIGKNTGGQLGGFAINSLKDSANGIWQAKACSDYCAGFGGFANGGNSIPYSEWELYLMGMLPVDSLPDIVYFTGVTSNDTLYAQGKFRGTKNIYTVSQFRNDFGDRIPSFLNSQKKFKVLPIVLTPTPLSDSEWVNISNQIIWLTSTSNDNSRLYNFYEATRGVGQLSSKGLKSSLKKCTVNCTDPNTPTFPTQAPPFSPIEVQFVQKNSFVVSNAKILAKLTLFNTAGKSIKTWSPEELNQAIDLSGLAPGKYVFHAQGIDFVRDIFWTKQP